MTSTIAQIALDQWEWRLRFARDEVRARRMSAEEADARLCPWLAIALRAGAVPPEAETVVEPYLRIECTEPEARALAADYLCELRDLRAELARARDAAIDAALAAPTDARKGERSHALQSLAIHLGAPATRNPPRTGEGDRAQHGGGGPAQPERIAA